MARDSDISRPLATAAALVTVGMAGRWLLRHGRKIDFGGRHVLITGGSRGLGLILARRFASQGARLTLCARDGDELRRVYGELARDGVDVRTFVADVTDPAQVGPIVDAAQAQAGAVDVLINNAGVIEVGPHDAMTLDDYDRAMRTHFWGPLHFIRAVLPGMRARAFGRIVNIASIGGKVSVPHLLPYSASKFALVGLSEGLRAELARDNVLVTTVCPGLMRTGSPRQATVKGQHRTEYALFATTDSLPGLSISAERAARRIVEACRYGEAEVILGASAQAATWVHGLWPGLTSEALSLVARALPRNVPGGDVGRLGAESESPLAPSPLTVLSDRAAVRNNELDA